jgi:hypothetical protein
VGATSMSTILGGSHSNRSHLRACAIRGTPQHAQAPARKGDAYMGGRNGGFESLEVWTTLYFRFIKRAACACTCPCMLEMATWDTLKREVGADGLIRMNHLYSAL